MFANAAAVWFLLNSSSKKAVPTAEVTPTMTNGDILLCYIILGIGIAFIVTLLAAFVSVYLEQNKKK